MQPATPEKRGQNRFDQEHYLDTIFGKILGSVTAANSGAIQDRVVGLRF